MTPPRSPSLSSGRLGKKGAGSVLVLILAALYAFAQPWLNDQFGWNLPGLDQGGDQAVVAVDDFTDEASSPVTEPSSETDVASSGDRPAAPAESTQSKQTESSDEPPLYGILREIGPQRYLSPAGLQYVPGSAEGHRLAHLRRHTEDQPTRPGKHGVFDGGMKGALETVDQAYQRAKKNQRTTKQTDRDRTIYTIDLGRRIGYVGGRDGQRLGNPMARRVKLVLEGTRVITAYPL